MRSGKVFYVDGTNGYFAIFCDAERYDGKYLWLPKNNASVL